MTPSKILLCGLSPTRAIVDRLKVRAGIDKHAFLKSWNRGWFRAELAVMVVLTAASIFANLHVADSAAVWKCGLYVVLWVVPFSRCNEVVYAFYHDTLDKLENPEGLLALPVHERIPMLIRSYLGLALNFSFIYFFLPSCLFNHAFQSPLDALYFSGVTIATLGYGDFLPTGVVSRLLAVYEVLAGVLLLVISLAVYVALFGKQSAEPEKENDEKSTS